MDILFGLLNILVWVIVAAIVVYVIIWIVGMFIPIPDMIQRLLWALVGLIALIMLLQLLLTGTSGVPRRIF